LANLYAINQAILDCVDFDTGEVIDPERLNNLQMERSQKIENIVLYIKNLESDALAFKAEKEAFADREKAAKTKAEQLKNYLAYALEGQKFSTGRCAVTFRKSEQVEVLDVEKIPLKYLVETVEVKPDKKTIKALLKEGQEISGCRLVENLNPQIK
jgi:hypothetical protein